VLLSLAANSVAHPKKSPAYNVVSTTPSRTLLAYTDPEGTSLSRDYEAGRVPVTGIDPAKLVRPYDAVRHTGLDAPLALTLWSPDHPHPKGPPGKWPAPLRTELRHLLDSIDLSQERPVELRVARSAAPDDHDPVIRLSHDEVVALHADLHKSVAPRKGGMVYLIGGQLVFRNSADAFADAKLDVCGNRYCLRFASPTLNPVSLGDTVDLPFSPSFLFTATWQLTHGNDANALYLSINPLRKTLAQDDPSTAPSTRLELDPPPAQRANEIVTAGGIDGTELGKIFLDADVAFKSASLGFDVLAGHSGPTVLADKDLPDPLTETSPVAGRRLFCRYAWQSNSQTLEPGNGVVRLSGPAIRAEAEPMRLVDGDLAPAPNGSWCGPAKALAGRLNDQLRRGKVAPAIAQLNLIGSIQNLAVFARQNHMEMTEAFEQSLRDHPAQKAVPLSKWTSGIRSHVQPVLRLDYRRGADGNARRVIAVSADGDDLEAFLPAMEAWTRRIKQAAERSPGKYDKKIVEREQRVALQDLAKTWGARILAPQEDPLRFLDADRDFLCCFDPIELPVEIHGGVLLRALQASKDAAALESTLLYPNGTPLFRADARDGLHFWSFRDPGPSAADIGAGEHLEIRGGRVIAHYAIDGKLRFVVQGKQVDARYEARLPDAAGGHGIVEWTRSLAVHGALSDETQVVWLDPSSQGLQLRPVGSATSPGDPALPVDELRVKLYPLEGERDLWSVEVVVPFAPIEAELQRRYAAVSAGSDIDAIAKVIVDAGTWGAHDLAHAWNEELGDKLLSVDSVDTLYSDLLSDPEELDDIVALLVDIEDAWLSDAHNLTGSRAAVVKHLDQLAALLQGLPPPLARDSYAHAATTLHAAAASTRDPQRRALLEARARDHERAGRIAAALVP
jgi:hypothetical protein